MLPTFTLYFAWHPVGCCLPETLNCRAFPSNHRPLKVAETARRRNLLSHINSSTHDETPNGSAMHSYLTHRAPFGTRGGCAQAGPRGAYTPCCASYAPSNRHRAIGIRHQRLRAAGAAGAAARRHELEEAMRTALAAEDYATAARLKQEIAALPEEREASLRRRLQEAIAAERYQVC